jgi:hypothetical protein
MPIQIVDPNDLLLNYDQNPFGANNRFNNYTPEYQNMVPYAEFFAVRKNVLVNYLRNSTLSTDSFERINLLGFDENPDGQKVFTARYLDADPNDPRSAKEAFGIKSIEVKTNASYVPVVNITFIDVKGQSYFAKNGNSSYGVLLDFPPPLFVLRMKGVYGLMVEYRLHLTTSNITFNSKNGNYEIKCSFVGYNLAPFTDITTGLLTAVHFISPDLTGEVQYVQNGTPRSFFELILKGDVLYNKIDTYKNNSKDLGELQKINNNLARLSDLRSTINTMGNVNNFISYYSAPDNNNLQYVTIQDNQSGKYLDIQLDYTQLAPEEVLRISKLIDTYFRQMISNVVEQYKDFSITTKDLKFISPTDQPINSPLTNLFVPAKNEQVNGFSLFIPNEQQSIKFFKLEYKDFEQKVDNKEDDFNKKKEKTLNKIQTNVGDLADIDVFQPTIKNIVDIITKDIDRFFSLMVDAALKKKNSVSGIQGVLQWPEYNQQKNVAGSTQLVKVYPGINSDFKDWGEVELVENIVGGLTRAQKAISRLDELQSIENGDSKWTPIVPFESRTENITQNEYFTQRINPGLIFENIHKRYCAAKNYTYKGYIESNEILDFIARAEARNLLYAVNNEDKIVQLLNNFATNYQPSDIDKFLAQIPTSSVYNKSNADISNLVINGIELKQKLTTSNPNALNQQFGGLSIVDASEVRQSNNTESENKIAELIDSVSELITPMVAKFSKAKINMSSDNLLVFMDSLKIDPVATSSVQQDSATIDTPYSYYTSDFFEDYSLTNTIKSLVLRLNKTDKQVTMAEFFTYCTRYDVFFDFYETSLLDNNIAYKFFFPGLIEIPKVYQLYLGHLLANNALINNDQQATSGAKSFSNKLSASLTEDDKELLITQYEDFLVERDILLDDNFYREYSTSTNVNELINTYIDDEGVEFMDKTYLMNSTPITFSYFTPNNLNIPRTFAVENNSKNFSASDCQFKTMNSNSPIDRQYLVTFFNEIKKQIVTINKQKTEDKNSENSPFGDNDIKGQLYYSLKSIYDRWLAIPDNIQQSRNLYEELFKYDNSGGDTGSVGLGNSFKYVDRTMSPVAQNAIMDYRDLVEDSKDFSINVYTLITKFFSKNNFLFWPLQSSLVFDPTIDGEKWKNSFRLVTDNINSLKSKPAFVCMFNNSFSSNLNIDSQYYPDDGLSFLTAYSPTNPNDTNVGNLNPLPNDFNNGTANVFVFIVSFGKQNQSIFGNIQLSTAEFNDTFESLKLTDLISKKNNDSNPISKGQNLYNVYAQRSYSATIDVPFGNMCIQPTMYFELVGVPMFNGGYIITEVEHHMYGDSNKISTRFKGTRVGRVGLEMITDPIVNVVNSLGLDTEIAEQVTQGTLDPTTYSIYNSMSELKI